MKLPDFRTFAAFLRLKRQMGLADSAEGSFRVEPPKRSLTAEELELLVSGEGIDVSADEIAILPDGTLGYKDVRVLVYIRDVVRHDPRYHVMNCITLEKMRANRRFERYVVATEHSGVFKINVIEGRRIARTEKRRLLVCQNCLDGLKLDGFSRDDWRSMRRRDYVESFTPAKFFSRYPRSLITKTPEHTAETAPIDIYTHDFSEISRLVREERRWKCEKCYTTLNASNLKQYLHVHHIDGRKWNNDRGNLKVLCIECHAEEPAHTHLKHSPQYQGYLRLKRS